MVACISNESNAEMCINKAHHLQLVVVITELFPFECLFFWHRYKVHISSSTQQIYINKIFYSNTFQKVFFMERR